MGTTTPPSNSPSIPPIALLLQKSCSQASPFVRFTTLTTSYTFAVFVVEASIASSLFDPHPPQPTSAVLSTSLLHHHPPFAPALTTSTTCINTILGHQVAYDFGTFGIDARAFSLPLSVRPSQATPLSG